MPDDVEEGDDDDEVDVDEVDVDDEVVEDPVEMYVVSVLSTCNPDILEASDNPVTTIDSDTFDSIKITASRSAYALLTTAKGAKNIR